MLATKAEVGLSGKHSHFHTLPDLHKCCNEVGLSFPSCLFPPVISCYSLESNFLAISACWKLRHHFKNWPKQIKTKMKPQNHASSTKRLKNCPLGRSWGKWQRGFPGFMSKKANDLSMTKSSCPISNNLDKMYLQDWNVLCPHTIQSYTSEKAGKLKKDLKLQWTHLFPQLASLISC